MKNKKKIKLIFGVLTLLIMVTYFSLRNVLLWSGAFLNSTELTWEENVQIKKLVLSAVKDRCSVLYSMDDTEVYDEEALDSIQNDTEPQNKKSWICLIGPFFMNSVIKVDENEYQVKAKILYPENCYYEFSIKKDSDNNFYIKSFLLDI